MTPPNDEPKNEPKREIDPNLVQIFIADTLLMIAMDYTRLCSDPTNKRVADRLAMQYGAARVLLILTEHTTVIPISLRMRCDKALDLIAKEFGWPAYSGLNERS